MHEFPAGQQELFHLYHGLQQYRALRGCDWYLRIAFDGESSRKHKPVRRNRGYPTERGQLVLVLPHPHPDGQERPDDGVLDSEREVPCRVWLHQRQRRELDQEQSCELLSVFHANEEFQLSCRSPAVWRWFLGHAKGKLLELGDCAERKQQHAAALRA